MGFYKIFEYTLNRKDGYSLTELLIVLALIGMLLAFVSSIYLFAERAFNRWMQSVRLENELHTLLQGMANDIYRADFPGEINSHFLELMMPGDTSRTYEWIEDTLHRDGLAVSSEKTKVVSLVFSTGSMKVFSSNDERRSIAQANEKPFIQVDFALANRTDTLASRRAVHLRRPQNWNSLQEE